MRIVYCVPSLQVTGGYEKVISYKANYLADVAGFDVTIVAYNQCAQYPVFPLSQRIKFVCCSLKEYFANCEPIDILISSYPVDARFAYKVKCATVHICEIHRSIECYNWYAHNLPRRIFAYAQRWYEKRVCRNYDRTVLLTEQERNLFWGKEPRIDIIPNPLTIQEQRVSELRKKRVIAVGRISYQKGFDRLIDAWNIVDKKFPDWELAIVGSQGDSLELKKVKTAIVRYSLKNVKLLPPTYNIAREYEQSSLLVMTSRYEGFGLVLTEAMACGLPCVSFDCHCGPREVITDGRDGLLVSQGDIEGLANAIIRLISNDEERQRFGANALEKSKQYELPLIMNRWISLFKELLNQDS